MNFVDITDITIPEGSVEKITETSTGRVLWQKKLKLSDLTNTHWETIPTTSLIAIDSFEIARSVLDTGNGVEIFSMLEGSSGCSTRFHLNTNGSLANRYTMWRGTPLQSDDIAELNYRALSSDEQQTKTEPIDTNNTGWSSAVKSVAIDPVSKVWCAISNKFYAVSSQNPTKWQQLPVLSSEEADDDSKNYFGVTWSPKLKRFCVWGQYGSCLIDNTGLIRGSKSTLLNSYGFSPSQYPGKIVWSEKLELFVCNLDKPQSTDPMRIYLSSDGLTWNRVGVPLLGDTPIGSEVRDIEWMSELGVFVLTVVKGATVTVYKSNDGYNFEYVKKFTDMGGTLSSLLCYSPDQNVLLLLSQKKSYITRDLVNWTEIPYHVGTSNTQYFLRITWSKSFNAFIGIRYAPSFGYANQDRVIYKLSLD